MGLLTNGSEEEDRKLLETLLTGVLGDWENEVTVHHGVICYVTESGMSIACKLAKDKIFNGDLALASPGPFKRAAAMCVLALYLPSFVVVASKGDGGVITRLSGAEKDEWLARFAFNLIAPALGLLETTADGHQMNHAWLPPSPHFQIELIAWLKVLEAPFDLDASGVLVLDVARVTRAILALGLIIEACYYLIDPTLRGKGNCVVQAAQKHGNDLEFGLPPGTLYPSRSSNW